MKEETFTTDEIEDVRVIIKAKGKHWGIVPKTDRKDEADMSRLAMLSVLLDSHFVVSTSLEDLKLDECEEPDYDREPDMDGFDYKTEIMHQQAEAKKLK